MLEYRAAQLAVIRNYRKRLTGDLAECTPLSHLLVPRRDFGRSEISKQSFRPIKILLPDETVMEVFSDLTKIIYNTF